MAYNLLIQLSIKRGLNKYFKSIFFLSLTKPLVIAFIFLFCYNLSYSQDTLKISSVYVNSKIKEIDKLISKNKQESYFNGIDKLNNLENELIDIDNSDFLCDFYLYSSSVFLNRYDLSNALKYINKGLKLAIQTNNNRKKGLFYESLGVVYNFYEQKDKRDAAFYKSKEYLTKYAPLSEQSDMYYNLSYISLDNEAWDKSLEYALKCDSITRFVQKEIRGPGLLLGIAECYVKLNKLEETRNYLDRVSSSDIFDFNNFILMQRYYKIYGELLLKEGDVLKAIEMYKLSNECILKVNKQNILKINENLTIQNKMQLAVFNYEKLKKETVLKNLNSKYQKYILILATIIIIGLILLLIMQIKSSKYKTKTNLILSEKNIELSEALSIKNRFLDTITHELRTPLNSIKGISYLMKDDLPKEEQNKYIETLSFSSDYLLSLINNIIEYNIMDKSNKNKLKNDPIEIKTLLKNIYNSFKIKEENNNKIHLELDENIPNVVLMDAFRVTQILINLISNSLKFTKNGDVYLRVLLENITSTNVHINFEIQDTGIGIDKNEFNKIFDPFYQVSKGDFEGSGLGLSIVAKTLNLLKSKPVIVSEIGKGTSISFSVSLEVYQSKMITVKGLKDSFSVNNIKILLVEDNKVNQLITKKILTNQGFECDIANDGFEAVRLVEKTDYSLILMDIMMPVMDGFEASEKIKQIKPSVPIIALTAMYQEVNRKKFEDAKIIMVLTKPVSVEILCEAIYDNIILDA